MRPDQLIAHRGFCARYPENTILAFEEAVRAGALAIEADLQLSRDGEPFVFHDRELDRLCGCGGALERRTADQIRTLSAHHPGQFGDRFLGEPVPHLNDLLALLRQHPQLMLYLEIKRVSLASFPPGVLLERIWPLIWPLRERIVLISFSLAVMAEARRRGYPRLAPVLTRWSQLARKDVLRLAPEALFLKGARVPQGAKYRAERPELILYQTSSAVRAAEWLAQGVARVETDDIGWMISCCGPSVLPETG